MSILGELKALEDGLRGIKAPRGEGAGHNFGRSRANKLSRGKSGRAPKEIYDENMRSEYDVGKADAVTAVKARLRDLASLTSGAQRELLRQEGHAEGAIKAAVEGGE